jgi:hypothetical protein
MRALRLSSPQGVLPGGAFLAGGRSFGRRLGGQAAGSGGSGLRCGAASGARGMEGLMSDLTALVRRVFVVHLQVKGTECGLLCFARPPCPPTPSMSSRRLGLVHHPSNLHRDASDWCCLGLAPSILRPRGVRSYHHLLLFLDLPCPSLLYLVPRRLSPQHAPWHAFVYCHLYRCLPSRPKRQFAAVPS